MPRRPARPLPTLTRLSPPAAADKIGAIEAGMKVHFVFDLKGGSEGPEFTVSLITPAGDVTSKVTIFNGLIDGYSLPAKMALAVGVGRGGHDWPVGLCGVDLARACRRVFQQRRPVRRGARRRVQCGHGVLPSDY